MIDAGTEEPVDPSDRVKGYQVSKGQYVMVEDADLEALKIESTKMIEIEAFVPQSEVDQTYLDSLLSRPTIRSGGLRSSATPWPPRRWSASGASS
jgi:non-homologous end joining protein Ku